MLMSLAQWLQTLSPEFGFLRVFQYLTFRALMAALTALLVGLLAGPYVIRRLAALKIGQPVRGYGMETHLTKSGTPTMGGVLVLFAIAFSTLMWFDLSNRFVWIVLWVTLGFGAIGWVDDWRKVVRKDPEGMRSREKYFWQSVVGLVAGFYLLFSISESSNWRVLELFVTWVRSGFDLDFPPKINLLRALLQGSELPARRHRLRDPHLPGDRRREQRGQPDRRARRAGDHAGRDGRLRAGRVRLCHRQRRLFQVPAVPAHPGLRRTAGVLLGHGRRRAGVPVVQHASRRRCSWATWARWRWAARWAPSRSSCGRRSCSS